MNIKMAIWMSLVTIEFLSASGRGADAQVNSLVESPGVEVPNLVTDRPDFTESAHTVPQGMMQIESGMTYEHVGGARATTIGETLVRVATGSRSEIRLGLPSYITVREGQRARGLSDAFLGAKFSLSQRTEFPLALIVGLTLPTGSRQVAARKFSPEVALAGEVGVSKTVGLAFNLGAGLPDEGSGRFSQYFGSVSMGVDLSARVGAYLEAYVLSCIERDGASQKFVDGGFTYLLKPNLQLDARAGLGVGNDIDGPDYFYGLGVVQRF